MEHWWFPVFPPGSQLSRPGQERHAPPTESDQGIPGPREARTAGFYPIYSALLALPSPLRPSGAATQLKMTSSTLVLLFSLFATVPALPPPQPTTTTEVSVQSRTNGLINDVKEINLFLNIPKGCDIVYDGLIKQLEGCRSGSNHGDPRLTSGCLLKLDFTHLQQDCANTALFFPVVKADPTPPEVPCNGTYCP